MRGSSIIRAAKQQERVSIAPRRLTPTGTGSRSAPRHPRPLPGLESGLVHPAPALTTTRLSSARLSTARPRGALKSRGGATRGPAQPPLPGSWRGPRWALRGGTLRGSSLPGGGRCPRCSLGPQDHSLCFYPVLGFLLDILAGSVTVFPQSTGKGCKARE